MQVAVEEESRLADYVSRVTAGEPVVFTRNGRTVARMVKEIACEEEQHASAVNRLMQLLQTGYNLGGARVDRDELYDRAR